MEGNLLAQGNEARCILQGKGVVHEDASFWLESNFFLGSEDPFEGFFAFSATESQNYRLEADFSSLQKQHIQLLSEISPVSLPYYKEGTFAGKITSFWTDRELTKLFIEDFQANDLYLQKETTDVIFPHLSGKAEFSSEKDKIHIDNLSLSSQDGSVIFFKGESRRVDELQFLLSLQNDKLEPSIFQGKFLGSEMGLYLEGDIENTKVNLTINSKPFEVLQVFFPNLYPYFKKDFEGHLTLQFVKDHDNLSGTLDLAIEDQNIGTLSFDTKIEEKSYEIASGKFAANFPSPKVPSAILKMVEPDLNLYGSVACKGTFDKKEVSLDLEAESFSLEWKEKLFFFEQVLGKKKWKFVYEKTADSWKVDVPIAKACLKYHDFTFENIEAELKGTIDQKSSLDLFIFKGDVFGLPKAKASNVQTHIQYTNQAWILEDLLATMQVGVSAFTLDIPTFVFSDGRMDGLIKLLSPEEEILQIRGRATLDEDKAIVDLSNDTHFLGIALAVKELEIRKGELAVLDMHPVATQAQMIKAIDLVVKSELASNSIASIEKNLPEGNMRAHLVYKKNIFSFQIDGHNATFGKDVKKTFHASGKKIGNHYEIEKMTLGDLVVQASFMVEDEQVRFSDVTVKNDGFFAKAKGVLDLVGQDCVLEVLSSSWEDPKMDLQLRATGLVTGNMKTEEFRASCALKGDMGEVHISSKGEIPFLYTLKEGLVLPEAQLSFYYKDKSVALCKLERCTGFAQDKGLLVQHIEFSISPSVKLLLTQHDWAKDLVWKGYLEGEGMLEVLGRGIRFQGSLIDSDLSIREVPFVFRGINFAYNQGSLKLSMRALSDKLLFDVDMNAKINEEVKLGVEVKRSGEVLVGNAHYDGGELVWESISGKILGIECRGAQVGRGDQKAFSGEIAFDIDSMQPVLSKELYKQLKKIGLTKGYRLQGDFFPKGKDSVFYGKLLANDFDFLGYVIDSLQADMTMTSSNIDMKNLHIDDSALALHIKEMSLTKENEKWFANAPLVKLQNFKPSSLKNKYEKQEDKPFIIKNAVVADLKGCLDNLESFTGQGKAFFTNLAKQESHFFLPSELLKDLGLDPQVFVPITGECNYLLESGKLYLQDLSHTYSEGKRSEFYLAPNGERSYLDMSGNLFIDVRMKQHVIVKLTEPFILRVRGNLKQPKYSLHRSK